jgi:hypothetical protein
MKKSSILVTACLVVCGLFLTQPAFAALYIEDYIGPWESTTGSILTVEYGDSEFGFYDFNDETTYYDLSNKYNIFEIDGDLVTVSGLADPLTFSLNDGDVQFGFYMKENNGSTVTIYKEADVTTNSAGMYVLDFGGGSTLELAEAYPSAVDPVNTPVPTAALLLGSGLVGLVGFRRKTAQN